MNKKDISFNCIEKQKVRNKIIEYSKKCNSILDLYGNGEFYKLAKKNKLNITSIDDGRDFNNIEILKKEKNVIITSLRQYAINNATRISHDLMWLDFCGTLNKPFINKTIPFLPNIMEKKGFLFITLLHARESYIKKGEQRKKIDKTTQNIIKKSFAIEGIKLRKIEKIEYNSIPKYNERKKKGGTPMVVFGFSWSKKENFKYI